MKNYETEIREYASIHYPGCYLTFTGKDRAVLISADGKMRQISYRRKRKKISWCRIANWLVPAVIWFWELWILFAMLLEFWL